MFEYALGAGLVASGADAYLLHVTTTPSVSYVVRSEDFDCGIMITASHNPYTDNGIKLINSGGYKMEPEVLELIEDYIDGKSEVPLATGEDVGRTIDYVEGRNRYIGFLISSASFSMHGMRIGLDCANGSSTPIAKGVFDCAGRQDLRGVQRAQRLQHQPRLRFHADRAAPEPRCREGPRRGLCL